MKALKALAAVLLTFTFATAITLEEANAAKRFGSGMSFGKTYKTAPAPTKTSDAPAQRQQADNAAPTQQVAATKAAPAKGGMMGGLMGGLLAGGLIAALFAGGAFEGLQLMDILIMAMLAFIAFKIFRSMRQAPTMARSSAPQPAYAGGSQSPAPLSAEQPAFGSRREEAVVETVIDDNANSHAVPFDLPLGFNTPAFLDGAKEHYRILQDAWNSNDMAKIEEYLTPELFAELSAERARLSEEPQTEVLSVTAELVRAEQQFGNAGVSVRFSGVCRDNGEGVSEDFVDIWHLERDYSNDGSPWFITGIQSE